MTALAFILQIALAVSGCMLAPWIARRSPAVVGVVCGAAFTLLLAWPLMRFVPTALIDTLGPPVTACIELTGLAVPATVLFAVAACRVPRKSDARALRLLILVAGVYFVRAGWWMVAPGVTGLGPTGYIDGVCRQTTGYTCVAASLVTALRARGLDADEEEMARLAHTEVGGGATDSRALWALQHKLRGTPFAARYQSLDFEALCAAPMPCLVQLDFSYFFSHMVAVLAADESRVVLGDPLHGPRTMTAAEFRRAWKGQALIIDKTRD